MVIKFFALILLISQSALALGPLDNGIYNATLSCTTTEGDSISKKVDLVLTENSMIWRSSSIDHKIFTFKKAGFFNFKSSRGQGSGYMTSNGIHFDAVIDGIKGEDTFIKIGDEIFHISSATWEGGSAKCEAIFRK